MLLFVWWTGAMFSVDIIHKFHDIKLLWMDCLYITYLCLDLDFDYVVIIIGSYCDEQILILPWTTLEKLTVHLKLSKTNSVTLYVFTCNSVKSYFLKQLSLCKSMMLPRLYGHNQRYFENASRSWPYAPRCLLAAKTGSCSECYLLQGAFCPGRSIFISWKLLIGCCEIGSTFNYQQSSSISSISVHGSLGYSVMRWIRHGCL